MPGQIVRKLWSVWTVAAPPRRAAQNTAGDASGSVLWTWTTSTASRRTRARTSACASRLHTVRAASAAVDMPSTASLWSV